MVKRSRYQIVHQFVSIGDYIHGNVTLKDQILHRQNVGKYTGYKRYGNHFLLRPIPVQLTMISCMLDTPLSLKRNLPAVIIFKTCETDFVYIVKSEHSDKKVVKQKPMSSIFSCYLLFFVYALFPDFTRAQTQPYKFLRLDINKGLSDSRVKCFLKDKKGFVWIGTYFGLNRFDGYQLKTFKNDPRDSSSLSESDINKLFEDPKGKIWVTTYSTQNIYDPETETFQRNTNQALIQYGIPQGSVRDITKGKDDRYWFSHATAGLFKYTTKNNNTIQFAASTSDSTTLCSNDISSLSEDGRGGLWIMHRNGVLEKLNIAKGRIEYRTRVLEKKYNGLLSEYNLLLDTDGDIWVYVNNTNKGVYYFDVTAKAFTHIDRNATPIRLNENVVRGLIQDDHGLIWVATDHGGINIIDKKRKRVTYIFNDENDEKSLGQNSVSVLYQDHEGFIWVGTFKKGVSYYHRNLLRFNLYQHQTSNAQSLPFSDINAFAEDEKGNIWIGTNGQGIIYYDRGNQTFTSYKNNPQNANSLSGNVIVSLFMDRNNNLWIGTYYNGLNRFDGKNFTRFKHTAQDIASISDDNIWDIYEDSQQRLWIGTLESGVDLFEPLSRTFKHFKGGQPHSVHTNYIATIREDKSGAIWFGTGYGLDVLAKGSTEFKHYLNDGNNPKSLSHNNVISLLDDKRNNLWVGTTEGLNLLDKETDTFQIFTTEDGLPHNTILTMQEDDDGTIWMSTPNGISNLVMTRDKKGKIVSHQFRNYSESDGLQGKQFNEGATLKTRAGEMIFGGSNGFNLFNPKQITLNTTIPQVQFTDFQILNKTVKVGEEINGQVVLTKSINYADEITLNHKNNVFSLEFVALSFFSPEKSNYKYMLKGFNKDWLYASANDRKVTYTNLDPGDYTFVVMASNNDGVWNENGHELKIKILPPFWKTKAAFFIYTFLVLGALYLSRQALLKQERLKYSLEKERAEALQVHELDLMKIKFFTNISHEFRTPLSLIITPIEKVMKQTANAEQKNQFEMIYRNARRLLNMVNQLLDFRKMEFQEVKLHLSEGDIIAFIKETALSFSDLSEKNSIAFSITSNTDHLETVFDKDKLEKILFNLLSNAFKFTREHGKVGIVINIVTKFDSVEKWLEVKVTDTGIGIAAEKHDKIFERFFQNDLPTSMVNQGSGIGLSITKEFVKAHGGSITVESEPEKGSCFIVLIPLRELSAEKNAKIDTSIADDLNELTAASEESPATNGKQVVLLAEDNEDFRFYLKDNLKSHYTILEGKDGKEAYALALQHLPDLIVSDVMMPEINGMELCKMLKTEKTTSHIPVVLLTARAAEEQKIEGFEMGADDYITKPFSFEILQSRIKNLIQQRALFHKSFRKQIEIKTSEITITSLDEKLIQNAIKIVEDNISNADFSVEMLSDELNISRVQLYKKLVSLTGKAPLDFIRTIRIQRAAQLLEKSQLTVSQVAYQVGFNNPKYFTRFFKDVYNVLPSAYAASKRKNS